MSGLLLGGKRYDVPGRTILGPEDDPRIKCVTRDRDGWIRQWFVHKTIADDPEIILPGAGPTGGALATILAWANGVDGANLVTDNDGTTLQLADLLTKETFHATVSNLWSIGHEIKENPGGRVYRAALEGAVDVILAGCEIAGIQPQMPKRGTYNGHPLKRMLDGGHDCVGIFGHRSNTERRGRWDPGDVVFDLLADRGVMEFDFAQKEDLAFWMTVQQDLTARRLYAGPIDGVPGPSTTAALRLDGYRSGIYALGKAA